MLRSNGVNQVSENQHCCTEIFTFFPGIFPTQPTAEKTTQLFSEAGTEKIPE